MPSIIIPPNRKIGPGYQEELPLWQKVLQGFFFGTGNKWIDIATALIPTGLFGMTRFRPQKSASLAEILKATFHGPTAEQFGPSIKAPQVASSLKRSLGLSSTSELTELPISSGAVARLQRKLLEDLAGFIKMPEYNKKAQQLTQMVPKAVTKQELADIMRTLGYDEAHFGDIVEFLTKNVKLTPQDTALIVREMYRRNARNLKNPFGSIYHP